MSLLFKSLDQYSSSLYESARMILRSRQNQAAKAEKLAEKLETSEKEAFGLRQNLQSRDDELERMRQQLHSAQRELQELRDNPITLPADPPVLHHKRSWGTLSRHP